MSTPQPSRFHTFDDLDVTWQKATASGGNGGECFEFAGLGDGRIAVRHSKDPQGPKMLFTRAEMAAMLDGAKAGEFDHLGE